MLRNTGAVGNAVEIQRPVVHRLASDLEVGDRDAGRKEPRIVGQLGQAIARNLEHLLLAVLALDDVLIDVAVHARR